MRRLSVFCDRLLGAPKGAIHEKRLPHYLPISDFLHGIFQRCNQAAPLVATMQPEPRERRGSAVTAIERRAEIMRILTARRSSNIRTLAAEMGVHERTIRRDVVELTTRYPLETQQGKGGCVKVTQWYHPHRNIFFRRAAARPCRDHANGQRAASQSPARNAPGIWLSEK